MGNIIKSNSMSWLDVSAVLYRQNPGSLSPLYSTDGGTGAFELALEAIKLVEDTGDIGSLSLGTTLSELETLNENRRRLIYFCNGIHYEISELVDTPFSTKLGDLAEDLIALNPTLYKKKTSGILWWKKYVTLTDLISSSLTDDALKDSFDKLAESLDNDYASADLMDSIKEANFWEEQFEMSELVKEFADNLFTDDVRENWPKMTEDERKEYISAYVEGLSYIYGDGYDLTSKDMEFNASGYGVSYKGSDTWISVNPLFASSGQGDYSIDKMIDTTTHEMRHQYQYFMRAQSPDDTSMSASLNTDWNSPYTDPSTNWNVYYHSPMEEDAKGFAAISQNDHGKK